MFTVPVLDIKSDPLDVLLAVIGYRLSMLADSDNEDVKKILADRKVIIELASTEADVARYYSFDNGEFSQHSGHAKEAKEYIKELYTCNKGLQGIIYSGNIVIDSILSNGLTNLENRGINLKCSIIIPPSLNIADVDLCILFGNLIDNAVEACERIVEPGRKKFIS